MEFTYFNPNPDAQVFKSGKPKSWNRDDSAIRAFCKALNLSWNEVFTNLSNIAAKLHDMPNSKNAVNEFCIINNFNFETFGKPKVGCSRPTVSEFVNKYNKGTYICYLPHYFVCIKDGIVYNTEDVGKCSIYSYWKLN